MEVPGPIIFFNFAPNASGIFVFGTRDRGRRPLSARQQFSVASVADFHRNGGERDDS